MASMVFEGVAESAEEVGPIALGMGIAITEAEDILGEAVGTFTLFPSLEFAGVGGTFNVQREDPTRRLFILVPAMFFAGVGGTAEEVEVAMGMAVVVEDSSPAVGTFTLIPPLEFAGMAGSAEQVRMAMEMAIRVTEVARCRGRFTITGIPEPNVRHVFEVASGSGAFNNLTKRWQRVEDEEVWVDGN